MRDRDHVIRLKELGWHVLTIWECELTEPVAVATRVQDFLKGSLMSLKIDE